MSETTLIFKVDTGNAEASIERLKGELRTLQESFRQAATANLGKTSSNLDDYARTVRQGAQQLNNARQSLNDARRNALNSVKGVREVATELTNATKAVQSTSNAAASSISDLGARVRREEEKAAANIEAGASRLKASMRMSFGTGSMNYQVPVTSTIDDIVRSSQRMKDIVQDPSTGLGYLAAQQKSLKVYSDNLRYQSKLWEQQAQAYEKHQTRMRSLHLKYVAGNDNYRNRQVVGAQGVLQSDAGTNRDAVRMFGVQAAWTARQNVRSGSLAEINSGMGAVSKSARGATDAMGKFNDAQRETHSLARGLSGSLNTLWLTYGSLIPLMAGAALGGIAKNVYSVGSELEYRLKFVKALGNRSVDSQELAPAVLGSMKTPLEAAEAMQALTQAGLSSDKALQSLNATMQLSTMGELSMAEAATTVTTTLSAFNLEVTQANRIGDVLSKAAAVSNTSVAQIAGSMRQASVAASQYGIEVETVTATLAVMAKNNIVGSAAGTSFRNMAKELYTPIARGAKMMDAIGLSAYDSAGAAKDLVDVMQELRDKLVGISDDKQNQILEALFGERGSKAAKSILQDMDAFKTTLDEVGHSAGFNLVGNFELMDSAVGDANRIVSAFQLQSAKTFSSLNDEIRIIMNDLFNFMQSKEAESTFTTIAGTVATLVRGLTELGPSATMAVKGFLLMKGSTVALNTALSASKAVRDLLPKSIAAETLAIEANTAAKRNNARAGVEQAIGASAPRAPGAGLGTAVGLLTRLTSVVGWLSIGLSVASLAYDLFKKKNDETASALEASRIRVSRFTDEVTRQRQEIEKNNQETLSLRLTGTPDSGSVDAPLTEKVRDAQALVQHYSDMVQSAETEKSLQEAMLSVNKDLTTYYDAHVESVGEYRTLTQRNLDLNTMIEAAVNRSVQAQMSLNAVLATTISSESQILGLILQQNRAKALAGIPTDMKNYFQLSQTKKELEALQGAGKLNKEGQRQLERINKLQPDRVIDNQYKVVDASIKGVIDASSRLLGDLQSGRGEALALKNAIPAEKFNGLIADLTNAASSRNPEDYKKAVDAIPEGFAFTKDLSTQLDRFDSLQKSGRISDVLIKDVVADSQKAMWEASGMSLPAPRGGGGRTPRYQPTRDEKNANRLNDQAFKLINSTKAEANTAYIKTLEKERDLQMELDKFYLTDREREGIEGRNKLEDEYNRIINKRREKMEELQNILDEARLGSTEYSKQQITDAQQQIAGLRNANVYLEEQKRLRGEIGEQIAKANYDQKFSFAGRMTEEFKTLEDANGKMGYTIADSFLGQLGSMSDGLADFAAAGEGTVKEFTANTLREFSRMAMKMATNQLLMMLFRNVLGFGMGVTFGDATDVMPGGGGGVSMNFPTPSYHGNVFQAGNMRKFRKGGAFTNGITTGTNVAPMAMFGEGGREEAIVPLTRMSNGDLGVQVMPGGMGGGGTIINVSTNVVVNSDGSSSTTTNSDNESMATGLGEKITSTVRALLIKESGQGGIIYKAVRGR